MKILTPILNILRTPLKSAIRPIGSSSVALESRNAVTTHPKATACIENSLSIAGRAMFIDEIRKVPIKEVMATMAKIENCRHVHCIFCLLAAKDKNSN